MKLPNPFLLNDWNIRSFLIAIYSLQFAYLGSVGLKFLGLSIPLLQQILGFFILTFVPGFLILRVLRVHRLSAVETTVYAVGLSLAVLMFTGFFINIIFPLIGLSHPISLWSIVSTISVVIVLLSILTFLRDRTFSSPDYLNLQEILSPPVLALSLLPFGAVAGTYLMNLYDTNIALMILLPVVAAVPVVAVCTSCIPKKYSPYAVFSVALTLLYHTALISMYIWGWDIQYEYYLSNVVIQNGFWDPAMYSNCNAMLSLVMLAPFYSVGLNLSLDWVFKIVYPFLFALVPLGLYIVFKRQTNDKIAFLACFFFVSQFVFFTEMLSLARQEIAELFFVLIILLIIDRSLAQSQRAVLFLVFSMSLIVSHYGLSYLFMFILFVTWGLATLGYHFDVQKYSSQLFSKIQNNSYLLSGLNLEKFTFCRGSMFSFNSVLFYGLFILIWYIYMSGSSSFDSVVQIGYNVISNLSSELLNPSSAQGLAIITAETTTSLHEVSKYLQLLTIFFIVIGFIVSFVHYKDIQFDFKYLIMAFGALCICVGGVILPYFASALNTSRLYQISIIILAPFCVVGGIAVFSGFRSLFGNPGRSIQILSVFMGIFLLFNCGWIYEINYDEPTSIALNSDYYNPSYNEAEVCGVQWIVDVKGARSTCADTYMGLLFKRFEGSSAPRLSPDIYDQIKVEPYIFLGSHNTETMTVLSTKTVAAGLKSDFFDISPISTKCNLIYSSEGSQIYS